MNSLHNKINTKTNCKTNNENKCIILSNLQKKIK